MFICNIKINKKKLAKLVILLTIILALAIIVFSIYKIVSDSKGSDIPNQVPREIKAQDYTSFLKDCHENTQDYIGKSFTITGYVYRLPDFNENQFVLSRTMIINEANSAVVVGILSECSSSQSYADGDWITVTGIITKGYYKGEMPILEIKEITKCDTPEDEYVYPPSGQMDM